MNLIRGAIARPIAMIAAVLMIILFGLVALQTIPIQLTPDVRKPVLTITTDWLGAAPAEVEREVTNRQEDVLKGLEGMARMVSQSQDNRSEITLEFKVGHNMDRALLLVANSLDRVAGYPEETDEPSIRTASAEDQAIAWFIIQRIEGNNRPIYEYGDFIEDTIKDRLERVPGVARVNVFGGSERELRITVDPKKMARYSLTVPDVVAALRGANTSISAGDLTEGKRRYIVRTDSELKTPERVRAVLLRSAEDRASGRLGRVTLGDIGDVRFGHKDPVARIRTLGEPAMAVNAIRETGANVMETMKGVRQAVAELNESLLPEAMLTLEHVYDETVYIDSAIELVQQNIWMGGTFAVIVLMLFLRSFGATLIIAIAIPVSVVGSFVAMALLGRSINVVSLAGFAFAVGMVVDAAIVVLENIYRLRQRGLSRLEAAYQGASQVWGAVFVSALTTVLVFVPILVMQLEAGQLFRDIAVAISVSVLLSLVIAITLIPSLASRILSRSRATAGADTDADTPRRFPIPIVDHFARGFVAVVMGFTRWVVRGRLRAIAVVVVVCGGALFVAWQLLPKLDYLPEGNRNLVFGVVVPPPGYNLDTTSGIAERIENAVRPLWASETGPESEPGGPPKMERFFFVTLRSRAFVGAVSMEPQRAGELIDPIRIPVFKEPGTFGFVSQTSLFGRAIGGGRKIDLDISGPDLETILEVAVSAVGRLFMAMPFSEGNQMRPVPGLELGAPEVRITPDQILLGDNGLTALELGLTVDAFNDGLRVDEITIGGKRFDLMLTGPEQAVGQTQDIDSLPVVTRDGTILPVGALADILVTEGPTLIRHVERERTVTLEIRPAAAVPLEVAMETLKKDVIGALEDSGLPPGVSMHLSGTADQLTKTWDAMVLNLLLAIVIVYLIMAVLFESFIYPFIIMLSVPTAAAGGVLGLILLNYGRFQPLDMLTVLGFVILVGIVVNNAILLVHQTLHLMRSDDLEVHEAILEATRNRIRPIFMSTVTSVVGMLPLVLFPGAGSELYRGLGSVVVGGLALSAILTLLIIPPMMTVLARKPRKKVSVASAREQKAAEGT
ncbi:MAG: efflux RND transporter permease subunit [Alphaproteobacteria bacterium]|jgi:HAE1 family hydrophobic/amphiphilic exporter-1|nr:efflux RND transporter permease subunit [Alphaproteobacteria bacterium]MDP6590676.1 efflux RND transporter permease subunit [Alphaproteobacteria bacterium]